LEVLADIDDDSPEVRRDTALLNDALGHCGWRTYLFFPSFPSIHTTADVFRLIFFFPSGLRVERHVLQGDSLSGAVRQDTLGKLPDVPVPKKMNSIAGAEVAGRSVGVWGIMVCCWQSLASESNFRVGFK
jgi:hypothetical protein